MKILQHFAQFWVNFKSKMSKLVLALSIVNLCWNLYLLAGDVLVLSLDHGLVHVEFLFRDDDGHVAQEARVCGG